MTEVGFDYHRASLRYRTRAPKCGTCLAADMCLALKAAAGDTKAIAGGR